MKTIKKLLLCAAVGTAVSLVSAAPIQAQTLSYADLVSRLTDMEQVAVLPLPGEKTALASSYDRASVYDEKTGQYLKWDANGDGHGIVRREGENEVLGEMDGPGVIWRIWSATPKEGHVRIYLDGKETPAVDLPFTGYFDGKNAPFNYPALVYKTASNGFDSYVPISFQKHCKIVADKSWGDYFQFTYSTFPQGTMVPTFTRDLDEASKAALTEANRKLSDGLGTNMARRGEETMQSNIIVPAKSVATIAELDGPQAITNLRVQLGKLAMENAAQTFREAVLRIYWDDQTSPSVWVPLGDFFGAAPGFAAYKTLPLGMTDEGMYSNWFMPFRKARLEILNEGEAPLPMKWTIKHAPLSRDIGFYGRFHAKWHRDSMLPDPKTGRAIDWPMLVTQGRGRFVGVMLHVWNPRGGWWGEGDEKFFVDGEKFPSTIGTGSEDYFGYAWSSMKVFNQALHSQPNSDARPGNNSVNRWHIADNVPFQSGIEADIEKYFPNSKPTLFAATAYWYLQEDGSDPYGYAPLETRIGYYQKPPTSGRVKGALEGEELKISDKTGGDTQAQDMGEFGGEWSNFSQLWWTKSKPGDKLTLAFNAPTAGNYNIKANFTKAIDYGIAQFSVDGEKLGDKMDFYNAGVIATGEIILGTRQLSAGEHKFTIEIVGANDKAEKGYMVGFDYLRLEAVK